MRKPLILAILCLAAGVYAADVLIETVDVSVTSARTGLFECGKQVSIRPYSADGGTAPDVSYRYCDSGEPVIGADGGTCVAVVTDMRLSANTTYDIGIPERSSSAAQCRLAFRTASGSGVVGVYNVTPRTIPQTP